MFISVTLLLIIISIGFFCIIINRRFTYWRRNNIREITPQFPYGNLKGIGKRYQIAELFQIYYEKFKNKVPFCGLYMFFDYGILAIDPDFAKSILIKDFAHFQDRGMYFNVRDDALGLHLFTMEGNEWKRIRPKLSPVFSPVRMKLMSKIIVEMANHFVKTITENYIKNSNSAVVNIHDFCFRFTTDVITNFVFGIQCNSLENENSEFNRAAHKIFAVSKLNLLQKVMVNSYPNIARFFRVKLTHDDVEELMIDTTSRTIDYREKEGIRRPDLMDVLIEMKNDNSIDKLTFMEVVAQSYLFFLTGIDTSSSVLCLCLYELAKNKEIQQRARLEVQTVIQKHNGQFSYEAISEMVYIDSIIKEELRMYPPIGALPRVVTKPYNLPDTKITLPIGTQVFIPILAYHRDPDHFPNPNKFDPDRFSSENIGNMKPFTYYPFGTGPRSCIGERFGYLQSKIGLIMLLNNFEFSFCSQTPEQPIFHKSSRIATSSLVDLWLDVQQL